MEHVDYTGYIPLDETTVANAGPKDIADMTLEEKVDEILLTMRTVGAALTTFQKMGPGGMMKAMMTGNFTGGK